MQMEAKDYLQIIRVKHKLTQEQVAARTGIPQPTISKIERGDVSDVMSKTYRALQKLHDELEAPEPA
jgi:transcriptional regulator with XRE-family HTH domain